MSYRMSVAVVTLAQSTLLGGEPVELGVALALARFARFTLRPAKEGRFLLVPDAANLLDFAEETAKATPSIEGAQLVAMYLRHVNELLRPRLEAIRAYQEA